MTKVDKAVAITVALIGAGLTFWLVCFANITPTTKAATAFAITVILMAAACIVGMLYLYDTVTRHYANSERAKAKKAERDREANRKAARKQLENEVVNAKIDIVPEDLRALPEHKLHWLLAAKEAGHPLTGRVARIMTQLDFDAMHRGWQAAATGNKAA